MPHHSVIVNGLSVKNGAVQVRKRDGSMMFEIKEKTGECIFHSPLTMKGTTTLATTTITGVAGEELDPLTLPLNFAVIYLKTTGYDDNEFELPVGEVGQLITLVLCNDMQAAIIVPAEGAPLQLSNGNEVLILYEEWTSILTLLWTGYAWVVVSKSNTVDSD